MKKGTKIACGVVAGSLVIGAAAYAVINSNNNTRLVQEQIDGFMQLMNKRFGEENENEQEKEISKEEEAKRAAGKSNDDEEKDSEKDSSVDETKKSSKNENLEEATYARGVYEKLKKETIDETDVSKSISKFCKKYDIEENTAAWSILHSKGVVNFFKTFKNGFQLENYMATIAFTHSFTDLTFTYNDGSIPQDKINFQLPEDNGLRLKLDPRDVLCVRAYLNDYTPDQLLKLFGQDIPSPDEIHNAFQRVMETMQVFYLNTHKALPLRFLFDDTKSVENERVSGLQKKIVNVNVKRDQNKLNSKDTDAVIADSADIFFNVRMNTYAELLAASMTDSFARINAWVDNGEPLIQHETIGEFEKGATNLLYVEEYDEENNPELYEEDEEAKRNPDRTYRVLESLYAVIARGAGNREENAERCVSDQQVMIDRALKTQELSVAIDTEPYILDFNKAMEKVIELLGLKSVLADGYNYSENLAILTRNRYEAAKDKEFTLAKGAKRYREKLGKPKTGGGSSKKKQKEEVKREEVKKEQLDEEEKEEAEKKEKEKEKEYDDKNKKQREELEKKKQELAEKIKNGASWEEIEKDANKYGIHKEWYDGKVKEKEGEEKKKQQEKQNKEKQKQQEKESKERKEKEKKENDEQVNKDNDLTRGETPQPTTTEQPTAAPAVTPSAGGSYYDDNPDQPIDHFSDYGDDDPYGDVIGNRIENRVRALTGNNMENLSEESVQLLVQFEKILDQKIALTAAAKGASQDMSEQDQHMKKMVFPNQKAS